MPDQTDHRLSTTPVWRSGEAVSDRKACPDWRCISRTEQSRADIAGISMVGHAHASNLRANMQARAMAKAKAKKILSALDALGREFITSCIVFTYTPIYHYVHTLTENTQSHSFLPSPITQLAFHLPMLSTLLTHPRHIQVREKANGQARFSNRNA